MHKPSIYLLLAFSSPLFANAQPSATPREPEHQHNLAMPNLADQSFVEKSTLGSLSNIELSKLALNKSKNGSILAFAQRMIDDHTAAFNQIGSIAKTKNVQVSIQAGEAQQQKIKQLSELSEPEFDKAFSRQMQENLDHAVALFAAAANDNNLDPRLKDVATNMLPTLRKHQRAAHDLAPH